MRPDCFLSDQANEQARANLRDIVEKKPWMGTADKKWVAKMMKMISDEGLDRHFTLPEGQNILDILSRLENPYYNKELKSGKK